MIPKWSMIGTFNLVFKLKLNCYTKLGMGKLFSTRAAFTDPKFEITAHGVTTSFYP